jgi:uncharacterized protein YaaQ
MKLLICIVQDSDVSLLTEDLIDNNYGVTKLSSTGGFLKSGNTTLLIGVEESHIDDLLEIVKRDCKKRKAVTSISSSHISSGVYPSMPLQINVGGATIFQIDVDQFYRI